MEYVKHRYSKRVYQIMTDHGPNHPYLWSPWEFSTRKPGSALMSRFFVPCEKPPEMPKGYTISILQEMDWERRQLIGDKPIIVHSPVPKDRSGDKRKPPNNDEYTLADLCRELGMSPAKARKLLRSKGKVPPSGGWKWSNREEAKPLKEFLKNL